MRLSVKRRTTFFGHRRTLECTVVIRNEISTIWFRDKFFKTKFHKNVLL